MEVVNKATHTRTKHDVYIGRPSSLGNPFRIDGRNTSPALRATAIDAYRGWLLDQLADPNSAAARKLASIKPDAILVCWCAPLPCHGDVIAEFIAERTIEEHDAQSDRHYRAGYSVAAGQPD